MHLCGMHFCPPGASRRVFLVQVPPRTLPGPSQDPPGEPPGENQGRDNLTEVSRQLPIEDVPQYTLQELLMEAWDQVKLSAPVCFGLLCDRFVSAVSIVVVGHLGAVEFAAVGLAVSLANVSGYSFLVGVATTLQTTTGQAFGANNFTEVSLSIQRCGLLCSLLLCMIMVIWLFAEDILLLTGQDKEVATLTGRYLRFLLPGLFCYMVTQCLQNWLGAQRVTSPNGSGGLILAVVYLPLCWLIVHPLGFGFVGAALSTSMAYMFLMLWMVYKTRSLLRIQLSSSWQGLSKHALTNWFPFLRLAFPNFLLVSEWWAAEITVILAGRLPNPALSLGAMALMANTNSICFMPPLGLSMAVNTRVSNELGAGHALKAAHAAHTACILGLLIAAMSFILVLSCRQPWGRLFTSSEQVLEYSMPILSVSAVYVAFDGICAVFGGSLKGCGRHALLAPVILFSYYLVGLPVSIAWSSRLGTLGLALGSLTGTVTHCFIFFILLACTRWPLMAQRAAALVGDKPLLPTDNNELDEMAMGS